MRHYCLLALMSCASVHALQANDFDCTESEYECYLAYNDQTWGDQRYALSDSGLYRDYNAPLTQTQRNTIAYIVNTLAESGYGTLLLKKGELDRAGATIDNVHPLRHLEVVFTDERLKVNMLNIRRKDRVWKKYIGDLAKTMAEEYQRNNISNDTINDFAQAVQVDHASIAAFVSQQRFRDLIEYLTDAVPRQGNTRRYDM